MFALPDAPGRSEDTSPRLPEERCTALHPHESFCTSGHFGSSNYQFPFGRSVCCVPTLHYFCTARLARVDTVPPQRVCQKRTGSVRSLPKDSFWGCGRVRERCTCLTEEVRSLLRAFGVSRGFIHRTSGLCSSFVAGAGIWPRSASI